MGWMLEYGRNQGENNHFMVNTLLDIIQGWLRKKHIFIDSVRKGLAINFLFGRETARRFSVKISS